MVIRTSSDSHISPTATPPGDVPDTQHKKTGGFAAESSERAFAFGRPTLERRFLSPDRRQFGSTDRAPEGAPQDTDGQRSRRTLAQAIGKSKNSRLRRALPVLKSARPSRASNGFVPVASLPASRLPTRSINLKTDMGGRHSAWRADSGSRRWADCQRESTSTTHGMERGGGPRN